MSLFARFIAAIANLRDCIRAAAWMYAIGGPVGAWHGIRLARIKSRIRANSDYVAREKDLHREHLRILNHEGMQLVQLQHETAAAAAQFWNWCEKKAQGR